MTDFLDEHLVEQKETTTSTPSFIAYLFLSLIESLGFFLLLSLCFGLTFTLLVEPLLPTFLVHIIGSTIVVSTILFSVSVPIYTLLERGDLSTFKGSLLKMNVIGMGLWAIPCLLFGFTFYTLLMGFKLLIGISGNIFFTSLIFKYYKQVIFRFLFALYWFVSILIFYW